jgi:hypothetical protein
MWSCRIRNEAELRASSFDRRDLKGFELMVSLSMGRIGSSALPGISEL